MRLYSLILLALSIAAAFNALLAQKAPPETIVFTAKNGNVTFNHAAHTKRANNDCQTCHDKLFPQSRAPINFKAGLHKTAEAAKTSCGGCHTPGGPAFESKGNCAKCHAKS
jgi:c(7)-type cytochrome triheme protein